MRFTLKIWRQPQKDSRGAFKTYEIDGISPNMSILETLDLLNMQLIERGEEPVAFESDCREGICGTCGLFINGRAHGPLPNKTTCEVRMRHFRDGSTIIIEPFRAKAFPVIKDLIVDRSALDKIMQAGGYISVNTGQAPEANSILVPKEVAEEAFSHAACIGCGACVAACKNSSAMLFVAGKIRHLNILPQGAPEALKRAISMVKAMEDAGFGACSFTRACEVECPKKIPAKSIAYLYNQLIKGVLFG